MTHTGFPGIPDPVRSHVRIVSSTLDSRQKTMISANKPPVAVLVFPSAILR